MENLLVAACAAALLALAAPQQPSDQAGGASGSRAAEAADAGPREPAPQPRKAGEPKAPSEKVGRKQQRPHEAPAVQNKPCEPVKPCPID